MINRKQLDIRSFLFTPADKPELFRKAVDSAADLVILDLEDAVAVGNKQSARAYIQHFFESDFADAKPIGVRINGVHTTEGLKDLLFLNTLQRRPDVLLIPKYESSETLRLIKEVFPDQENILCIALIETAYAVSRMEDIARQSQGLYALMLGAADLCTDMNAANTYEVLLPIRSRMVVAAAAAGINVIDTPFFDLQDNTSLEHETSRVAAMGFTAKAAIHPRQLTIINHLFTPSQQAAGEAEAIIAAASGGVGVVGGKMVDAAMAGKAKKTLARFEKFKDKH